MLRQRPIFVVMSRSMATVRRSPSKESFMRTLLKVVVLSLVTLIASAADAKTVQVGTCEPQMRAYSTITQAVSSVPAGSIVWVCPGTYAEQVTITKPLTLRGAGEGNEANRSEEHTS